MPEISVLIKLRDEMSKQLDKVTSSLEKNKTSIRALGVAMTGFGIAGLKLTDDSREYNAQLKITGITIGATEGAMRDMAIATADVSFPLKSVAATFEILARAGVRSTSDLKNTAKAFDALASATGSSAEALAEELVPSFKALGVELPQTSTDMDQFTWLTKNTTVDLSDFASAMSYVARYGADLGITLEDMTAIMAALEAKGISGSAATRLFRTAINEASDGTVSLNQALGLTQGEIDGYKTQIAGATGLTDKYSDAADSQFGVMDKLHDMWSKLTLRIGTMLEPLEGVFGLMTSLGGVFLFLSTEIARNTIKWVGNTVALVASKVAMIAATVAAWSLSTALKATGIGLLIGGVIALGVALWNTFGDKTQSDIQATTKSLEEQRKELDDLAESSRKSLISATTNMNNWANMVDDYYGQVATTNAKYIAEEQRITGEYEEQLRKRTEALYDWIGLFDAIPEAVRVSGEELLANLQDQVNWMGKWAEDIATLAAKGIDEGLLTELRNMGPEALPQLEALVAMTNEQLTQYVNLWQQKTNLARVEAGTELAGLKQETLDQIAALQPELDAKLTDIDKTFNDQFIAWAEGVPDISTDLIDKLVEGKTGLGAILSEYKTQIDTNLTDAINTAMDAMDKLNSKRLILEYPKSWSEGFTGEVILLPGVSDAIETLATLSDSFANLSAKWNLFITTDWSILGLEGIDWAELGEDWASGINWAAMGGDWTSGVDWPALELAGIDWAASGIEWESGIDWAASGIEWSSGIVLPVADFGSYIPIPTFQTGGITPETGQYLVGEKGPELVSLPGGAQVFSNEKTIERFHTIREIINKIIPSLSSLSFSSLSFPSFGLGGASAGLANIPKFDLGGIATKPMLAQIAERGPEAIIPLRNIPSLGGKDTYNITIQAGAFLGDRADAEKFGDLIMGVIRKKQRLTLGEASY